MTVKELIAKLERHWPDAEVVWQNEDHITQINRVDCDDWDGKQCIYLSE